MTHELPPNDPFREEADLQAWTDEMGESYEVGSQGTVLQPFTEINGGRYNAHVDMIVQQTRKLSGLPPVPDDEEIKLHKTIYELGNMPSEEAWTQYQDAMLWLTEHPGATMYSLIDHFRRADDEE